jgi:large subunit ribosomal protein L40e
MAKFEEAENRLFKVKICLKCNARNPPTAKTCRKCGYKGTRLKNQGDRFLSQHFFLTYLKENLNLY